MAKILIEIDMKSYGNLQYNKALAQQAKREVAGSKDQSNIAVDQLATMYIDLVEVIEGLIKDKE